MAGLAADPDKVTGWHEANVSVASSWPFNETSS